MRPLHTRAGMFRDDAPEVGFAEALESMDRDPRGFANSVLQTASGVKLRVSVAEWADPPSDRTTGRPYTPLQVVRASERADSPDVYYISTNGTDSIVQALAADGREL